MSTTPFLVKKYTNNSIKEIVNEREFDHCILILFFHGTSTLSQNFRYGKRFKIYLVLVVDMKTML